jgi:hypothetical protein
MHSHQPPRGRLIQLLSRANFATSAPHEKPNHKPRCPGSRGTTPKRAANASFLGMIKRILFAVLVFAAPVCPVSAQHAKVSIDMMGIGGMSCTHWRSTQEHRSEGTIWIYGFWTGLNYVAAASDQRPAKIDVSAIVAEVEKTCALRTSQTLANAVWTTYLEFSR